VAAVEAQEAAAAMVRQARGAVRGCCCAGRRWCMECAGGLLPTLLYQCRRFKGITWDKANRKWRCQLPDGKTKLYGNLLDSQEESARQYAWWAWL